jgi:hypothetical protein
MGTSVAALSARVKLNCESHHRHPSPQALALGRNAALRAPLHLGASDESRFGARNRKSKAIISWRAISAKVELQNVQFACDKNGSKTDTERMTEIPFQKADVRPAFVDTDPTISRKGGRAFVQIQLKSREKR